ncbi:MULTISPECIES: acetyl-CoA carboxylase biotin carboxyl carrier protein [Acidobacterium]|uniref:Biotin carboxyl carrier protein of acetyl-CoA carboxylase n=1 Tax=Acidobacterium capsulatum (strain ATCC 51196 / DSM 11244 / BCRC 80197 / JCM 7670 / NBRC 15755 / NCIMB 13165 / 161) TaxID=240015 RepID=C1F8K3_ACIC5|nr:MULTISPECIES: acetyl-CoA carboxylase biotin carboxyl carrier protein [Acidobacterium]ACO32469.1 acetyl-CoA carboxylase, biotin carboxyl carrier protein [Acidobacterium capsulatum ATCC 51196]HCT61503.1 acetyl-CoA carboxylase biotin carboxyl carrier protein [Acidobacterium sp.]
MNPEELGQLKELIEFLKQNQIGEFSLERGDLKVNLKFGSEQSSASAMDLASLARLMAMQQPLAAPAAQPAAPAVQHVAPQVHASAAAPAAAEDENAGLHIVKSPIVGTFYESPSPGTNAFVKIGDQVDNGQVLCIVEAMKLMNEIESDAAGEVVKRFVQNGQPVEYGQPLFALKAR